jgi:hypothetical protein
MCTRWAQGERDLSKMADVWIDLKLPIFCIFSVGLEKSVFNFYGASEFQVKNLFGRLLTQKNSHKSVGINVFR